MKMNVVLAERLGIAFAEKLVEVLYRMAVALVGSIKQLEIVYIWIMLVGTRFSQTTSPENKSLASQWFTI